LVDTFPFGDQTVNEHAAASRKISLLNVQSIRLGWMLVQRFLSRQSMVIDSINVIADCSYPQLFLGHPWFEQLMTADYAIFHKDPRFADEDNFEYAFVRVPEIWENKSPRRQPQLGLWYDYTKQLFVETATPKSNSQSVAFGDSAGFISDTDENWRLRKCAHQWGKTYFREGTTGRHQGEFKEDRGEMVKAALQINYHPTVSCEFKERIGRPGDGGKWVCDPYRINELSQQEGCLVYSFGSNGDASFEEAVHQRMPHCEIHTFDPNPWEHYIDPKRKDSKLPAFIHYHEFGIALKDEELTGKACSSASDSVGCAGKFKTVKTIVKELGHVGRVIEIFKIDCEGCEWVTYPGWLDESVTIRQINAEIHYLGAWGPKTKVTPADENFEISTEKFFDFFFSKGYVVHHKEINTQGGTGMCTEISLFYMPASFHNEIECAV